VHRGKEILRERKKIRKKMKTRKEEKDWKKIEKMDLERMKTVCRRI
jgi:hypothetical protein